MRPAILAASAALILIGSAAASEPQSVVTVAGGDRVYSNLDLPVDRDEFSLEVADGALFTVTVKALGKGGLLPTFDLSLPDGTAVDMNRIILGEGTSQVTIAALRAPASGRCEVSIHAFAGTTGDYLATFSVAFDPPPSGSYAVPPDGSRLVEFSCLDGAQVSFTATEQAGNPLAGVSLTAPSGDPVPGSEGVRKGTKISAKKVVLAQGAGKYGVLLQGDPLAEPPAAGDTTVDLKIAVKLPKAAKRKLRFGPEPRPESITPATGPDGTSFAVQGANFAKGARVLFDGTVEATEVELAEDGSLQGIAPKYAGSDIGVEAEVRVLNPDGQVGIVPSKFRFIGIPGPLLAVPSMSSLQGGVTVTILGARFRPGLLVRFGGLSGTNILLANQGRFTCTTPAHASGTVTVEVVDEYGRAAALAAPFDYADPPVVSSVAPGTVPSFGGQTLTVTGLEFVAGDRVLVDGVEATGVSVASRTSLSFAAPPGPSGTPTVQVVDPLGRAGSLPAAYRRTPSLQPTDAAVPSLGAGSEFSGRSLAVGDVTGDGAPDIVVAAATVPINTSTGQKDPASRFLVNDGQGSFSDATVSGFAVFRGTGDYGQADALSVGDLDGQGTDELLLSRATPLRAASQLFYYYGYKAYYTLPTSTTSYDWPTLTATRLLRTGGTESFSDDTGGALAAPTSTPAAGLGDRWQAAATALGDLDGDGAPDLLLAGGGQVDSGTISNLTIQYTKKGYYYYYYYYYYYVIDKVVFAQTASQVGSSRVILNDGSGYLAYAVPGPAPLTSSTGSILDDFRAGACAAGDLDGDGLGDAVLLSTAPTHREVSTGNIGDASALRILFGTGSGGLEFRSSEVPVSYDSASGDFWQGGALALGDLDGDGDLDILVGRDQVSYWRDSGNQDHLFPAIRILRNDGTGTFADATDSFLDAALFRTGGSDTILGARAFALTDLDGDGKVDLLVTSRQTTVVDAGTGKGSRGILPAGTRSATRVLLNDGQGRFVDHTTEWVAPVSSGNLFQADAIGARDLDGDGRVDLVLMLDSTPSDGKRPLRVLLTK